MRPGVHMPVVGFRPHGPEPIACDTPSPPGCMPAEPAWPRSAACLDIGALSRVRATPIPISKACADSRRRGHYETEAPSDLDPAGAEVPRAPPQTRVHAPDRRPPDRGFCPVRRPDRPSPADDDRTGAPMGNPAADAAPGSLPREASGVPPRICPVLLGFRPSYANTSDPAHRSRPPSASPPYLLKRADPAVAATGGSVAGRLSH